jgi:hypothetical protein
MKELKDLLKQCKDVADELRRLTLMEQAARQALEQAADNDLELASVQRKVSDARITLDLVSSRRKKLKDPWQKVQLDLAAQLKAEVTTWNNRVVAARKAKEDEIVRANLPFHEGNESEFRKRFNFDAVPAMLPYRKAFAEVPRYENPADADLLRDVGLLIAHIQRWGAKLGLS